MFSVRAVAVVALAAVAACGADPVSVSRSAVPGNPNANIYPAAQYKPVVVIPGQTGVVNDVNDRNELVGYVNGDAFYMPWGGSYQLLPHPGFVGGSASVINVYGAIGGYVATTAAQPAYWPRATSSPMVLKREGMVQDMNDRSEAVGYQVVRGIIRALYWETATGVSVSLPRYATGGNDVAYAINNDRIVVGISSGVPVMWRNVNGAWTVTKLKGIFPMDIDGGNGTVGYNASTQAAYGQPSLAGLFGTSGYAMAHAVNYKGVAAGDDRNLSTGVTLAWVADRFGTFLYLPFPFGSTYSASAARGINTCGMVVGSMGTPFSSEAAVWDPGC